MEEFVNHWKQDIKGTFLKSVIMFTGLHKAKQVKKKEKKKMGYTIFSTNIDN